jgi:cell division protein ZapA
MKQIDVEIMGQSYRLSCPIGGEARFLQAVERVDAAMCKIRDGGKVRARDRIAVLAALNLAFDITDQLASSPVPATHPSQAPAMQPSATDKVLEQADPNNPSKLQTLVQRLDAVLQADS